MCVLISLLRFLVASNIKCGCGARADDAWCQFAVEGIHSPACMATVCISCSHRCRNRVLRAQSIGRCSSDWFRHAALRRRHTDDGWILRQRWPFTRCESVNRYYVITHASGSWYVTIVLLSILSKKPIFTISCNVCYFNFYISSVALILHLCHLLISSWFYSHPLFLAQNSL